MSSSSRVFNKIRSGSKSSLFIDGMLEAADNSKVRSYSTIGSMQQSGIALKRECTSCGHGAEVDIEAEIKVHGADAPLPSLAGECESCGSKAVSVLPA
jgi:hypothetical protein